MAGNSYTPSSVIVVAISIFLLLSALFLGYAFLDREPIEYDDVSFPVIIGKAYSTFHQSIEDGFEFGFILPEIASDISFTLAISSYSPIRGKYFDYEKMVDASDVIEEYKGRTEISVRADDYYGFMNVYLYITDTGDTDNGTTIIAQYFEQRGALASRTASFGIVFYVFAMFWIIFYGSMRREINMMVRDYRRAWLIRRGKLEAAPSVTNEPDKAFDFVFENKSK